MDFVANKPLHECLYHICVEPDFLPEGASRTKERGECCAPFSTKNISKHTFFVFGQILAHDGPKYTKMVKGFLSKFRFDTINLEHEILEKTFTKLICDVE